MTSFKHCFVPGFLSVICNVRTRTVISEEEVDLSLTLCADVLTVGVSDPKVMLLATECPTVIGSHLFSADIVEHFLLFYYSLIHESSIFVDW